MVHKSNIQSVFCKVIVVGLKKINAVVLFQPFRESLFSTTVQT